jgi:hypothetical protein
MNAYLPHQQGIVQNHGQHHLHRKRADGLHTNSHFDQLVCHIRTVLTKRIQFLNIETEAISHNRQLKGVQRNISNSSFECTIDSLYLPVITASSSKMEVYHAKSDTNAYFSFLHMYRILEMISSRYAPSDNFACYKIHTVKNIEFIIHFERLDGRRLSSAYPQQMSHKIHQAFPGNDSGKQLQRFRANCDIVVVQALQNYQKRTR